MGALDGCQKLQTEMEDIERLAWKSFKEVVKKFLLNCKDPDFKNTVGNMQAYLGCSLSLNLYLLFNSHPSYFTKNRGSVSEE